MPFLALCGLEPQDIIPEEFENYEETCWNVTIPTLKCIEELKSDFQDECTAMVQYYAPSLEIDECR